jgi:hypothetical protein
MPQDRIEALLGEASSHSPSNNAERRRLSTHHGLGIINMGEDDDNDDDASSSGSFMTAGQAGGGKSGMHSIRQL